MFVANRMDVEDSRNAVEDEQRGCDCRLQRVCPDVFRRSSFSCLRQSPTTRTIFAGQQERPSSHLSRDRGTFFYA